MKLNIIGFFLFLILLETSLAQAQKIQPIANAGSDIKNSLELQSVFLNGADSDVSASGITGDLGFSWEQISGTRASIFGEKTATPLVTLPDVSGKETITFKLTVTGPGGFSSADLVNIMVHDSADNTAPIADAGPNQTVASGTTVRLNSSGTIDPNGNPVFYHWIETPRPTVTLSNPYTANPQWIAPTVFAPTDLTFEVKVTDGMLSDTDSVVITVTPAVAPPPDLLVMTDEATTNLKPEKTSPDKVKREKKFWVKPIVNEILIGNYEGVSVIKANDVSLPELLTKITLHSGIDLKSSVGLRNKTISVDIEAENWTEAVQQFLKGYNRVDFWDQDRQLTGAYIVKAVPPKGRNSSEPALEKKKKDTQQVAYENKPVVKQHVLLTKDQLGKLGRGNFLSPISPTLWEDVQIREFMQQNGIKHPDDLKNQKKAMAVRMEARHQLRDMLKKKSAP